ncbi:excalibur calcium-binding domain-containing protein [Kribbella sp. VKM Ac-2566]|uniref:excalibur calcium-binding domain-containing protein n=1 Tax=Kribbella sp. VKM Ac-2566 TaxID=2512218 RepID=UPI0010CEEA32|nr:excalibur calcium-binding domain-containing protein [Kribbella sp. VKM Ac-2566]TDW81282.1 excalibur calcium-binding domain-containing protein [Kribbella sp. VKM Ac-2566]
MAIFNSPPGWPAPPAPDWQPPSGWQPDPSWPPAPPGWAFWLNARGLRTRGPGGRYGAEPPVKLIAGWVAGAFAFIVILAAIGGASSPAAVSSTPGATVTVPGPTTTVAGPTVTVSGPAVTVQQTVPGPITTITQPPLPARTVTVGAPRASTSTTAPVPLARPQSPRPTRTTAAPAEVYYANCSEVRAAGKAPLYRGQPGYAAHLDRDNDGVACE